MEEEYKKTLNIYKEEKIKTINELNNFKGTLNEKKIFLQNLEYLDDMIEKYSNKLSNDKEKIKENSKDKTEKNKHKNSESKSKSRKKKNKTKKEKNK